jgi:hypothetical protein
MKCSSEANPSVVSLAKVVISSVQLCYGHHQPTPIPPPSSMFSISMASATLPHVPVVPCSPHGQSPLVPEQPFCYTFLYSASCFHSFKGLISLDRHFPLVFTVPVLWKPTFRSCPVKSQLAQNGPAYKQ